jgi:uncharacterized membrane protein YgaE (UPF0421/DUF939 family)
MSWFSNFFKTNHRLGFRIVKTGIAATICVVISDFFNLNQPFFIVVAAVMTMGKSIDASVKSGRNKLFGLLIGTAIGYGLALVSPGNAGFCGVGIIITLYLCHLFKLNGAATLACFVFTAMLFGLGTPATCIVNSFIGIIIALLVNLIIMPPNYAAEIKNSCELLCSQIEQSVKDCEDFCQLDTRAIEATIAKLNYNINMYISQTKFLRWNDDEVFKTSCKISTYNMILDELKAIEVIRLTQDTIEKGTELYTVYNYHLNRMNQLYEYASSKDEEAI